MATSTLTKRIEFSASHFYHNPNWDAEKNRQIFGPCCQEHGHNYLLEVALGGRVDPVTGMIINLYDLKHIVTEVLEEFDHKHLNLDTPYFESTIPTTENLALVLWRKFCDRPETKDLHSIRLWEGEHFWAELFHPNGSSTGSLDSPEPSEAYLTRRYAFTVSRDGSSSNLDLWHLSLEVTVRGPIDAETGRVTDIVALDELINTQVLESFHGTDLSQHPLFSSQPVTLPTFARILWPRLAKTSGGRLYKLRLKDQNEMTLDYSDNPE